MHLPWLACTVCRPCFTLFWFPFPLWLALLKDRALLDSGLCFSSAHPFSCYHLLAISLYHSCCEVICLNLVGSLWACRLFFSQWPSTVIGSFITSLAGSCVPFIFPQASRVHLLSLALFLILHSHGILLNSLGFPSPITLSLIFRVHRFAINSFLSLLSLLWACRGPFSLFHIIYYPWFAFSLFPNSFKPIYLLKTHLFISWACDPLFLPLRLNEFSIHLPTLFCPCCWASSSHLGFQNGP